MNSQIGLTAMGDLSALNHGSPGDAMVQTPRATSIAPHLRAPTPSEVALPSFRKGEALP